MIASIAAEGQPTKPAPFGHALNTLAKERDDIVGYQQIYLNTLIYIFSLKKTQTSFSKWAWQNNF